MKTLRLAIALILVSVQTLPLSAPAVRAATGSTFTVTNSLDSGIGTLRWAIDQANSNPGPDTIDFNQGRTIQPASDLPFITGDGTVIDATWNWDGSWPTGKPGITLDGGAETITPTAGLMVLGAKDVVIKGLTVQNFDYGIVIAGGASNVTIGSGASGGRMVVRANRSHGIVIEAADDNKIVGSYIGTSFAGNLREPNGGNGVYIHNGKRNRVGIVGAQIEQNLIGASGLNGVAIEGSEAVSNTVENNSIGIGTLDGPITNTLDGVFIGGGASWNGVGGIVYPLPPITIVFSSTMGNTVYGSGMNGIRVQGLGQNNGVMANTIDQSRQYGIHFDGGSDAMAGHNTVVRTVQTGIMLDNQANRHWVVENWIGTDRWGSAGLGSGHHAIGIYGGAVNNVADGNYAVNSGWSGIVIVNSNSSQNWLLWNRIGIGPQDQAMGNAYYGIAVVEGPANALTANQIAYNGQGLSANKQILVDGGTAVGNGLFQNSVRHFGSSEAIALANGGNHMLAPPVITLAGCRTVSGSGAGPYGRVEVFSGDPGDATRFEGLTYADVSGNWTLANVWTRGPTLTATRAQSTTVPIALSAPRPSAPDLVVRLPGSERTLNALAQPQAVISRLETSPLAAPVAGGCALQFLPVIRR